MADVVVIGSIAVDEVVELAAPLCRGTHLEGRRGVSRIGGGAANSALALACAGDRALPVAAAGRDADGTRLLDTLAAHGVDTRAVVHLDGPTTRSLLLVEPGGERTVVNLARLLEPAPPTRLRDLPADLVYVRSRAPDLAPLLAETALRCPVMAHVPPCAAGSRPVQVLIGSASDLDASFLADPWVAGQHLSAGRAEWVVVTRGADGADAWHSDGSLHQPALPADPVDTTGAGDAFAAGLAHALAHGAAMSRALAVAAAWGAAATGWIGTVPGANFPPPGATCA